MLSATIPRMLAALADYGDAAAAATAATDEDDDGNTVYTKPTSTHHLFPFTRVPPDFWGWLFCTMFPFAPCGVSHCTRGCHCFGSRKLAGPCQTDERSGLKKI